MQNLIYEYFVSYHYKTVVTEGFDNCVIVLEKPVKGMDKIRIMQDKIESKLIKLFNFNVEVKILNIVKL